MTKIAVQFEFSSILLVGQATQTGRFLDQQSEELPFRLAQQQQCAVRQQQ